MSWPEAQYIIDEVVGIINAKGLELPGDITNLAITSGAASANITFKPPVAMVVEDGTEIFDTSNKIEIWRNTQEITSYGQGTLVKTVTGDEIEDYISEPYVDEGLTIGETYYYRLFIFNKLGKYNKDADYSGSCKVRSKPYYTYTIELDLNNADPDTWGTWKDDAVSLTETSPGGGETEIDEFMGYYPCMLKNGVEGVKLDPNNYAKDINGNDVDITSGNAGDVMVKFPARGFKCYRDGDKFIASITDDPSLSGYEWPTYKGTKYTAFYNSAYKGYVDDDNKLRSLSEKTVTVAQTMEASRTQAQNNGSNYEQRTWNELVYLQICALIKYKGKNMQIALGRGYVDGNPAAHETGGLNTNGLNYGETTGKIQMKMFGIEDVWGNVYDKVDGIVTDASYNILVADGNFNDTASGYTNLGNPNCTKNFVNYFQKPMGTSTKMGFIPDCTGGTGSDSTYFCDHTAVGASHIFICGAMWRDASYTGMFSFNMTYDSASTKDSTRGSSLTYFQTTA